MSSRFLSADLRSIRPEDFKLQKPPQSDRIQQRASAYQQQQINTDRQGQSDRYHTEEEDNRNALQRIIEEVLQTQPDPSVPTYMKELRHSGLSPERITSDRRTFDEEEEFSFEERRRPIRTEPDEPDRKSFLKKPQKVEHFYLNLDMKPGNIKQSPLMKNPEESPTKESPAKLADVKVLMQCVLEKISRSYRSDLRQYSGEFSNSFVSEMRRFLIGATHVEKRQSSVFSTPTKNIPKSESTIKKYPTNTISQTESLSVTQAKPAIHNPAQHSQQTTERRQQRYFSSQVKKVLLVPHSVVGPTRR